MLFVHKNDWILRYSSIFVMRTLFISRSWIKCRKHSAFFQFLVGRQKNNNLNPLLFFIVGMMKGWDLWKLIWNSCCYTSSFVIKIFTLTLSYCLLSPGSLTLKLLLVHYNCNTCVPCFFISFQNCFCSPYELETFPCPWKTSRNQFT